MTSTPADGPAVQSILRRPFEWLGRTRLRKNVAIAFGGISVALLLGIGAAVLLLLWRLSEGPIRLEAIDEAIEQAVASELGDVTVEIKGAELARDADGGTVVRLADITIRDRSGQFLARAPQAVVGTHLISAALGSVIPTRIELIGPHLSVRRTLDGVISLGFRPPAVPAMADNAPGTAAVTGAHEAAPADADDDGFTGPSFSPLNVLSDGAGDSGFLGTVNQLLVRNARLTLFDEASQSVWDSYNATLGITRPGGGIAVYVDAPFSTDSGEWRFRTTIERDSPESDVLVDASFDSVVPSEIAARMPSLADLAVLDLPVSGRISATVAPGGGIEATVVDLRLGAGFIRRIPFSDVAITPFLVDEGRIAISYERDNARLDLQQFSLQIGPNRVGLNGTIAPQRDENGRLVAAQFDLRSEDLRLDAEDLGRPAAAIKRALASGRISFDHPSIEIDTIAMEFDQGRITLGAMASADGPQAVSVQGRIEDLPVGALVQLWPRRLAPGARAWINARIPEGRITEGRISVSLDDGALADAENGIALPDEALSIEFGFDDVAAHYLDPLPPIQKGAGSAVLNGDRFVLTVDRASVLSPSGSPIAINFGRFEVPSFVEADGNALIGRINVGTASTTAAALEVLDLEPLEFTREIGVQTPSVEGEATIILDLALPLVNDISFDEVQFQAGATLDRLVVPGAFRDISLQAEQLEVIATHQRIDARGNVSLNGVNVDAAWEARFNEPGGRTNRLLMKADVDAEELARLGIDMRRFLSGTAPMTIEATGKGSRLDEIVIEADVTGSELSMPAIAWAKPVGEAARLDFVVERLPNDQVRLRDIKLSGDKVAVEGAIRLDPDGSLFKIDISRMRLGPVNDLQINGVRGEGGVLRLKVRGRELDAGRLLKRTIADENPLEPDPGARPTDLDFTFDIVRGDAGTPLQGATGQIQLREGKVSGIRLEGRFESGQPLRLDFGIGGGTTPAVVNIETTDAGAFVRFAGLYSRAFGGTMAVRAQGPDSKRLAGTVSARDFQIREEPLLIRIAQGASGLPASAARNVKFSKLNLAFERQGGAIEIKEALIAAPAVGASIRGRVDIAGEALGLTGTYIPAYGLNAALGGIPLFGPILSGRSGEGVFGMTFAVEGAMSQPQITINPVSTIAPGVIRRFFEFNQRR